MYPVTRFAFAALVAVPLAGCLPASEPVGPGPDRQAHGNAPLCSPTLWAHLKGQPASAAKNVTSPMRIIGPEDLVTTDHNPSRTNFALDRGGSIVRVFCG